MIILLQIFCKTWGIARDILGHTDPVFNECRTTVIKRMNATSATLMGNRAEDHTQTDDFIKR